MGRSHLGLVVCDEQLTPPGHVPAPHPPTIPPPKTLARSLQLSHLLHLRLVYTCTCTLSRHAHSHWCTFGPFAQSEDVYYHTPPSPPPRPADPPQPQFLLLQHAGDIPHLPNRKSAAPLVWFGLVWFFGVDLVSLLSLVFFLLLDERRVRISSPRQISTPSSPRPQRKTVPTHSFRLHPTITTEQFNLAQK